MGIPRGLIIATAYYNKIEALKDFKAQFERAEKLGTNAKYFAMSITPKSDAGWKTIDNRTKKLKEYLDTLDKNTDQVA